MPGERRTVLLIDQDPQVVRLVRTLDGPLLRIVVHGDDADPQVIPDLVLLDQRTGLGQVSGFVDQGCAVVVLSDEESLLHHFRGIQLGAWDYVHKPLDAAGLARLLALLVQRLDQGERPNPVTVPGISSLMAQLNHIEREAITGVLTLQRPGGSGYILFSFGEVQRAKYTGHSGHLALNAMAAVGDWTTSFKEEREDTDAAISPAALEGRTRHDRARHDRARDPGWRSIATRIAFYGPPTDSLVDHDPHEAVTRQAQLPPAELLRTVVDARPAGLDARPTEVGTTLLSDLEAVTTDEFYAEDSTTDPTRRAPSPNPYVELQVIYGDEAAEDDHTDRFRKGPASGNRRR